MTAKEAIQTICRTRWRRNFVLPNYTPEGWWECDLFEMTKAGFFREYEVKLTRADFLKDRDKAKRLIERRSNELGEWSAYSPDAHNKHELLAERHENGPSMFWFVVPEGTIRFNEVPQWAGLIELVPHNRWLLERLAVPAPKLHRKKIRKHVEDHARGICYWRMHGLMQRRA